MFYVVFIGNNGEMKLERKTKNTNSKKNPQFKTDIEDWMVPSVNMILIAHSVFGEFIFDAIKVPIEPLKNNFMKMTFLPETRKSQEFRPGEELEIKIMVDSKNNETSSLHLLSVDQRVEYFGNHNDISKEKVEKILEQYYAVKDFPPVSWKSNRKLKRDKRYDDLSKFNAFFITNAYIEKKDCSLVSKSREGSPNLTPEVIIAGSERSNEISIIREDFPETFIFEDIEGSKLENHEYIYKKQVPHSITSFLVNGFVFHPVHGLGIASERKFTVIKEFFTKVFMPHSIHVDEVLKLNVAAYNYFKASVDATISVELLPIDENIDRKAKAEFVKVRRYRSVCQPTSLTEKSQIKSVKVLKDRGTSAYFFIRATSPGNFSIKITASTSGRSDVMVKTIKVEPHGNRKSNSSGYFIDLRQSVSDSYSFDCEFPNDILNNTKKVFVTAYGNVLGQALTGVDKLIKQPNGNLKQI